ncbi:hypothetical protein GIB67_032025 [Kingdonia uniflora]|uniref:Uncharacterized protein n=1 Tax=Kingdonia uniflora TaxID=39325 RepID=A0A7J7MWP1_9MAGN|nr:hypothetical protein GIB67_032025 [Kingdonia uniflora]
MEEGMPNHGVSEIMEKNKILEWDDDCQPLGPNEPKLMSHLEKERDTNIEARDKIFKDVIGEDGGGGALCKEVVDEDELVKLRSSSSSFQNYEDEIAKL